MRMHGPPSDCPHHPRQEQRRALIAEKRDMGAQAAEMQRGLRRLGLAGRLGVAARDLAQESIEVPQEAIGRVRATYLIFFCDAVDARGVAAAGATATIAAVYGMVG